jgi:ABC-type transport system substrate-binding protein
MKSIIKRQAARLAALLVLAALLCAGLQVAIATENTMTIAIGDWAGIGTDPTLHKKLLGPDVGGWQEHHQFTHWSPLITRDNKSSIIPWLAESYDVSDDHKTITFHLRKGAKFADGKSLNASVLKFNFDRILTYGWAEINGKNGTKSPLYIYYDHSEASDEYTFKIYFTQGWLDMPRDIASGVYYGYYIHPNDVDPAWDIRGRLKQEKRFNGLGPYYVDENESVPNQKIVLKGRDSWRDDYKFHKPKLDKIVLKLIKDPQVASMALEKREIDYICRYWNVQLDSLLALEKNPIISIKTAPETRMRLLRVAYWKEPFLGEDGMLLRKAICYALNRTEMAEGAFNGYALPATDAIFFSPLRQDSPECCHKGYGYDLDKAKKLLAEAGWNDTDGDGFLDKNGKSLKDLDLVISSGSDLVWQKNLAVVVQSQLKEIGIDVRIHAVESSEYYKMPKTGGFDMLISYSGGGSWSAATELQNSFNREEKGLGMDYYSNQNKTLERIAENVHNAFQEEERDKYLCQACNILYEEAGIIPLVYEMQYAVMNSNVKGFQFGPSTDTYYLDHVEECWME